MNWWNKMQSKNNLKSITLGAIFAAIYAIMCFLSVYFISFLGVIGLIILPFFAAYYASLYKVKEILVFNIATIILCFISGISDPGYVILYVLPTLIIGDIYGLLNKLNIKYYTTIFLQTIAYSITNVIAIYLGELLYDTKIIEFIFGNNKWIYENLSLVILFIFSGAEAVVSSVFIAERLRTINIFKQKETTYPMYCYMALILLFIISIIFIFINLNIYFLCVLMFAIISFPKTYSLLEKINNKTVIVTIIVIAFTLLSFIMSYFNVFYYIFIVLMIPLFICSIFILISKLIKFIKEKRTTNL